MRSIALLANRESGRGEAARVAELLRGAGAEVEAYDVRESEAAAASGAERLVVAGGDGSIGYAADAASGAGIPIAVVATGTANDFAVKVGLPSDLEASCRLAVEGSRLEPFELARVGGRPYVNVASIGLAPAAAEHAHGLKQRLGALAYPLGALKAGAGAHPIDCRVSCDGEIVHAGEAWQVSVASTGAFGGGAELETDASDGRLDLIVIEGGSRARLAKHAWGLRVGSIEGQLGVLDRRCTTVEVDLPAGESLNVDGELVAAGELVEDGRLRYSVVDDAFELVVG